MNFAAFQRVYAASDVRTVMAFEGTYIDTFPHIAVQSSLANCSVELYCPDDALSPQLSLGANKSFAGSLDADRSGTAAKSAFLELFESCLDSGRWLLVSSMDSVSYTDWRAVAQRLATTLPDSRKADRARFRLLTFLPHGVPLQRLAPPLLCQFALCVEVNGTFSSRTEFSPIFRECATLDAADLSTDIALAADGGESMRRSMLFGRLSPYGDALQMRQQSLGMIDVPVNPLHPQYIDEVLCSLREALLEDQEQVRREVSRAAPQVTKLESATSTLSIARQPTDGTDPRMEPAVESRWVYERMLGWVVETCPEADISALPEIDPRSVDADTLAWTTTREVCRQGIWYGAPVLVKERHESLVNDYNDKAAKGFTSEAARQYALRHPYVLQLYGLSSGRMVLEDGRGTLEQALIRARNDGRRWTVHRFLKLAQSVLRGLCYLEGLVVHRDVACRSVIEISDELFKLSQFALAVPLKHSRQDAVRALIPVRWCAPEAIGCVFTPKGDVWSFGVMMWEALSYATRVPFDEERESPAQAIMGGKVLLRPQECPERLFGVVCAPCFVLDAEQRPTAGDVLLGVEKALAHWAERELHSQIPFPTENLTFDELRGQTSVGARPPSTH